MIMPLRRMPIVLLMVTSLIAAGDVPLRIAAQGHHQATVTTPAPEVWQVATTGNDPFVITAPMATPPDLAATPVLAFEYVCVSGLDVIEIFSHPAWAQERSVASPALPAREGWSPFAIDLSVNPRIAAAKPQAWRIDLGTRPGKVIQVRNLRLRERTPEEGAFHSDRLAREKKNLAMAKEWQDYLARDLPGSLASITATADQLTITGSAPLSGDVRLIEWPVWVSWATWQNTAITWPVNGGDFTVSVPRIAENGSDRALSRFALIQRHKDHTTLLSHGRWVDVIPAATTLPTVTPRSKKGLGGFHATPKWPVSDLDDLGIGSITVNVTLSSFFQAGPGDGAEAVTAGGETWYVRAKAFDGLDQTMLEAAKRNLLVLGIILVPPARSWGAKDLGRLMQHPDYEDAGIFTMPNLTSAESTATYTLALELLAKRYSRADGKYGRMHHWIMHNEVDMGYVWTNCGKKPELLFFEQYYRSMRLARAILKREDANAQVFISLTHHWAATGDPATCFPSRNLLGHLLALSKVEGDFDWGIAYHPYPASLLEPKTWLDQGAEFRLDTPKITFRNIEVLDAWARQPEALFNGRVRSIHLSEQGPNSPDYSERSLNEQAAAMAYVWKKIAKLDSILGFQYHNWVDNRHEGGLRIGLRRFPDDETKPFGTKPVWDVYRALGTPDEDRACAFALPLIGLTNWNEAPHSGPIPLTRTP